MKKQVLATMAMVLLWGVATSQVGINTTNPKTMLDVDGGMSLRESPTALSLSNSNNDNISLGTTPYSYYRITGPTNTFNITGIVPVASSNGQVLTLVNTTTQPMTLVHDATSTATNRIYCPGARNLQLAGQNATVTLIYNSTLSRWVVQSYSDTGAYGRNIYHAVGTSNISINITTPTDMADMSITFTPVHSVVYVNFSASGDMNPGANNDTQGYANFLLRRGDTTIAGTTTNATDRSLNWNPNQIHEFPFIETFEDDSPTWDLWDEVILQGFTPWQFSFNGAGGGAINTAHSGVWNYRFNGGNNQRTMLISPIMDITGLTNPRVSFWHGQQSNGGQKQLRVHYRISESDPWQELAHYTTNVNTWTQRTLNLPNPSSTYQIGFEGMGANNSYAVVLDDVEVYGDDPVGAPMFNLDTAWNAGFTMYPVSVTPGVETTINIRWSRDGLNPRALRNRVAAQPDRFHRTLTIID